MSSASDEIKCSRCDCSLPEDRKHTYCRDCSRAYARDVTRKKRRVSEDEDLSTAVATFDERGAMLSRVGSYAGKRWNGDEERLKDQLSKVQNYRCAVTHGLLGSLRLSFWDGVFVLPIVSVILTSFAKAPASSLQACLLPQEDSPDADAADALAYEYLLCSNTPLQAAALIQEGRHRVCYYTGIRLTYDSKQRLPTNLVYEQGCFYSSFHARLRHLKDSVPQLNILRRWWDANQLTLKQQEEKATVESHFRRKRRAAEVMLTP